MKNENLIPIVNTSEMLDLIKREDVEVRIAYRLRFPMFMTLPFADSVPYTIKVDKDYVLKLLALPAPIYEEYFGSICGRSLESPPIIGDFFVANFSLEKNILYLDQG